jgi:hypothetical protein
MEEIVSENTTSEVTLNLSELHFSQISLISGIFNSWISDDLNQIIKNFLIPMISIADV